MKLSGEYCERKIDFCGKEFNPCKNDARCIDHSTHYECQCPLGFSGDNCTHNIDDCVNHLCQVCVVCHLNKKGPNVETAEVCARKRNEWREIVKIEDISDECPFPPVLSRRISC